jgi:hypothetical protein
MSHLSEGRETVGAAGVEMNQLIIPLPVSICSQRSCVLLLLLTTGKFLSAVNIKGNIEVIAVD